MEKEPKKEIFGAIVLIAVVFLGFIPTIDNWFVTIGLCLKNNVRCSTLLTIVYILAILIVVGIFAYLLIIRPNTRKKRAENTPSNPNAPSKVDMSAKIDKGNYQGVSGDNGHVIYDNSRHFHIESVESSQTKSQNIVFYPEIKVEAPFTVMPSFVVVKFRIENKGSKKVTACHVKLNATEVHINENGVMLRPYPESLYPNKILWSGISIDGNLDLRPNAPEFLSIIELGQEHFRFLFHGDKPLKTGTHEPQYFSDSQIEWLSHAYYTIELSLFCDDINNESVRIENKFALSFNVAKHKEPSCQMVIKKIESYEDVSNNIEAYFFGKSFFSSPEQ